MGQSAGRGPRFEPRMHGPPRNRPDWEYFQRHASGGGRHMQGTRPPHRPNDYRMAHQMQGYVPYYPPQAQQRQVRATITLQTNKLTLPLSVNSLGQLECRNTVNQDTLLHPMTVSQRQSQNMVHRILQLQKRNRWSNRLAMLAKSSRINDYCY